MRHGPYCCRTILAAMSALWLSSMSPVFNAAAAEESYVKVETAGERAHFAEAFCQTPPERVEAYKARLRNRLPDVHDFDQRWQLGWTRVDGQVRDMSALRDSNPAEFASRIKVNCERLKWMAQNSLRIRPPK
jgi:hypothetical protein